MHIQFGVNSIAVGAAREHPVGFSVNLESILVDEIDRQLQGCSRSRFIFAVQFLDRGRIAVIDEEFWFQLKLQLPTVVSAKTAAVELQKIDRSEEPVL